MPAWQQGGAGRAQPGAGAAPQRELAAAVPVGQALRAWVGVPLQSLWLLQLQLAALYLHCKAACGGVDGMERTALAQPPVLTCPTKEAGPCCHPPPALPLPLPLTARRARQSAGRSMQPAVAWAKQVGHRHRLFILHAAWRAGGRAQEKGEASQASKGL